MTEVYQVWAVTRKSIVGHLVKPSFTRSPLNGKLPLIWYRFSHDATYTISYRFLREATGRRDRNRQDLGFSYTMMAVFGFPLNLHASSRASRSSFELSCILAKPSFAK